MKEIIGFSSYPDFSGNSKALFEDMRKSQDKYELQWFCRDEQIAKKLNEKGIKAIWDKSNEFNEEFNKTKIIINTHDSYLDLKRENQIFICLWHGLGAKKIGTLVDSENEWIYKFSSKNDYVIATSELGRMIFSTIFNMQVERVKQFPQARYKWLFENKGKQNLEKVLNRDLNQFEKIIMYAPTFRKGIGKNDAEINKENFLNINQYNEKILTDYLEKNNYLLVIKPHPVEENKIKEVKSNNIVILKDEDMLREFVTINEILSGIDLMISDYSSIYIDFINLERPVIFFDTDLEEYENKRGIIFETCDFWWTAGPKVHTIDRLIQELQKLLNDSEYYKEERKEFNILVNGKKEKNNDQLIKFILNIKKHSMEMSAYQVPLLEKKIIQLKNENEDINNKNIALINENKEIKNQKEQLSNEIREIINRNEFLDGENNELKREYQKVRTELDKIIYSRSYKIMQKIRKIIKKY